VRTLPYLFRFFRVVSPISRLMTSTFVVLTVVSGAVAALARRAEEAPLMPILVLQAFATATGFAAPARRGYYDHLLARGEPRWRIALAQWLTAAWPGVASWATLATLVAILRRDIWTDVTAPGTLVAVLMVSTIPWGTTVALPRFSGAIGWLLVVCLGSITAPLWPAVVRHVMFPLALVGGGFSSDIPAQATGIVLSLCALGGGLAWAQRTDVPLEAAQ
jgi:hypothetical protein